MWEALADFIIETVGLVIGIPEIAKKVNPIFAVVVFLAVVFICFLIWIGFYGLFMSK